MSAKQISALRERTRDFMMQQTTASMPTVPLDVALCICNRRLQDILCRSCGYIFVGRQRKRCPLHPNEILLMDSAVCPKCRTNSLMEIKTSEATVEKQSDEIMKELTNLRQRRSSGGEKCCLALRRASSGCFTEDTDWENEIGTLSVPNFLVEVPSAPDSNMKTDVFVGNGLNTMLVTAHASKDQPELNRPAASSYTQEVHRRVHVSEGTNQRPPLDVQHSYESGEPTAGAYKCQPKRPVSCDGENSVLKAVLKKSIAGKWDSGIDKMTDLCISERR